MTEGNVTPKRGRKTVGGRPRPRRLPLRIFTKHKMRAHISSSSLTQSGRIEEATEATECAEGTQKEHEKTRRHKRRKIEIEIQNVNRGDQ